MENQHSKWKRKLTKKITTFNSRLFGITRGYFWRFIPLRKLYMDPSPDSADLWETRGPLAQALVDWADSKLDQHVWNFTHIKP